MLSTNQKIQLKKWMYYHVSFNLIETATQLAEDAANHFELWDELDDPDSEIWDLAAEHFQLDI